MPMQTSRWWNGLTGLLSGLALTSSVAQYWLNCGTSLPAQTGFAVMLSLAFVVAALLRAVSRNSLLSQAAELFVLSASTIATPTLFAVAWSLLTRTGLDPSRSAVTQSV